MQKILNAVQNLENEGYQYEAAEASFDLLVMKQAGTYVPAFQLDHYRVNVENQAREPMTEAVIKLTTGSKSVSTLLAKATVPSMHSTARLRKAH
jgi:2-isopropylmalate synthase